MLKLILFTLEVLMLQWFATEKREFFFTKISFTDNGYFRIAAMVEDTGLVLYDFFVKKGECYQLIVLCTYWHFSIYDTKFEVSDS